MSAASKLINIDKKGKREAVLFIFVGEPGTGKSSLMKEFFSLNNRNLVVPSNMSEAPKTWPSLGLLKPSPYLKMDPTDPRNKKQIVRWKLEHLNSFQGNKMVDVRLLSGPHMYEFLPSILNANDPITSFQYGGFFIDDMKNYIASQGQLSHAVADPLRARRHIGVDFFFACHRFQDINSEFYGFGCKLWIFQTSTPPSKSALDRVNPVCQEQLFKVINFVNLKAKQNRHYYMPFHPSDEEINNQLMKEAGCY